jgi:hypothetical protein
VRSYTVTAPRPLVEEGAHATPLVEEGAQRPSRDHHHTTTEENVSA